MEGAIGRLGGSWPRLVGKAPSVLGRRELSMVSRESYDLILEAATLVDGTGAPAREADVAVQGPRIAAVAPRLPEQAKAAARARTNVRGRVLCPGFIDVHAHGELEPLADTSAAGKVLSGVTTEISGNCGLSPFPLLNSLRRRYEREAREEFGWRPEQLDWTTAAEFLSRLEEAGCTINRGFLAGHGSLRAAVHGYHDGGLTAETKARLMRELEAALDAGCFGLSTGLVYPPGCFATMAELVDLAKVCAAHGALYASHIRSEAEGLEDAIAEALHIARAAGVRTQISHLKTAHPRNWHKIRFLEETLLPARREGLDFHADRYPYVASSTGLDAVLPSWAYEGGTSEELRRLEDPAACAKLAADIAARHPEPDYWSRVVVGSAVDAVLSPLVAGRSVAALASEWHVAPFEALRRILVADHARTSAIFHSMSEDNLERILSWEFVMIGSDATARNTTGPTRQAHPHPRTFGTFPRTLARYVRDKRLLTLEEALRRMTSLPADAFHLRGRGRVEPGAYADLVLFDPARIQDEATFEEPNRFPTGLEAVYVNGVQVVDRGRILDARPGQVLRHPTRP